MELFTSNGLQSIDPDYLIAQVDACAASTRAPFNENSIAILGELSKKLMRDPIAAQIPQFVALGFWLRPSQLIMTAKRFKSKLQQGARAKARGIALHLPPQNVDTLFVYSWSLSFLAGNLNIVRLPSEMTDILRWLMTTIIKMLDAHGLAETQFFCRYPLNSEMTTRLSTRADLRIIWGGDDKITSVSRDPIRPDGLSLGFSDRKSFSIISTSTYVAMDERARDIVAAKLYNDIYWFDQMGCGSPRVIFWLGAPGDNNNDLYHRLDAIASQKSYVVETATALAKFSHMNERLASAQARSGTWFSNRLSVLHSDLEPAVLNKTQGGGLLYDISIDNFSDIAPFLNRQTQTITYLGLSSSEIDALSELMLILGGYRLVPVGDALTFSDVWDGIDLIDHMIRQITVK